MVSKTKVLTNKALQKESRNLKIFGRYEGFKMWKFEKNIMAIN